MLHISCLFDRTRWCEEGFLDMRGKVGDREPIEEIHHYDEGSREKSL